MMRSAFMQQVGENVDRLVSIDYPSYGVIGPLHAGARDRQPGPLCMRAAEMLAEQVTPGSTVVILTGLIIPGHHPYGETDWPLGAAVLARALALGLSARVVVAVEPELVDMMSALLRTAELQVVDAGMLAREDGRHRAAACVLAHSRDRDEARAQAVDWIERFGVRAVVAIEKAGANVQGIYHMVGGADISTTVSKGDVVFAEATKRGLVCIGIGDRGNELGMGPIAEVTRELLPFGKLCRCPCRGGVADQTPADLAVAATVSNWGAYGVVTCLAALLDRPMLLHTALQEHALLNRAVQVGGVDGMSGRPIPAVDGMGAAASAGVVELLAEIYRAQSVRDPSPNSTPLIKNDRP
jgi:hypothetical protein